MSTLRILTGDQWLQAWNDLPAHRREVYYHPQYSSVCADWEKALPQCVVFESAGGHLFYPFLKHPLQDGHDVQTAYGYGGPLLLGEMSHSQQLEGLEAIGDFLQSTGCVAEFVRCHTHWCDAELLRASGYRVFQVRTNVECDLTLPDFTQFWAPSARRNLRKALSAELKYALCDTAEDWSTFQRIYGQTADRLDMGATYRFDTDYFEALRSVTGVNLLLVFMNQTPVAGAIIFVGGTLCHYHLGGSDFNFQQHRPNDFLYYAMAQVARSHGCQRIVWGGGLSNDPADSLLRFKSHFGTIQTPVFCAGRVINQAAYQTLCDQWQAAHPDAQSKLFLKYRQP